MKQITKNHSQKVIAFRNPKAPAYPNAADRSAHFHNALDFFLTTATSAGIVVGLTFLIIVF